MPYPSLIDKETAIDTARDLIEREGLEALSLARLAAALGVKAPSLYRHFESKNALLRALNEKTVRDLIRSLLDAPGATPRERLTTLFHAYRAYAHQYPITYGLAFSNLSEELYPDVAESEALVLPLQALMASISGEADSLAALRGALALVHGFVMLELNGQFRRGGDLDAHFAQVIDAYIRGWAP